MSWRKDVAERLGAYDQSPSDATALALADSARGAGQKARLLRLVIAFGHLATMLRAITSLKWQPRLGVVTKTLAAAVDPVSAFSIVLVPTFIGFACSGRTLFGRRVQQFATLPGSMARCFEIAVENSFDWLEMSTEDFWTAAMWVWAYLLVVTLLMLNMLLATIRDIYQQVRREAGDVMTITQHLEYLYMQLVRHRKNWVSYADLLNGVSLLQQTVSTLDLLQAFPSMPEYQAGYLTRESQTKAQRFARVGADPSTLEGMVAAIHVSLDETARELAAMRQQGWMGKGVAVSDPSHREGAKDILARVEAQRHWVSLTQQNMTALQRKIDGLQEERLGGLGARSEELEPATGEACCPSWSI